LTEIFGWFQHLPAEPGGADAAWKMLPEKVADLKPILSIWYPQIINNTTCSMPVIPA
jgi:hypothetical protein